MIIERGRDQVESLGLGHIEPLSCLLLSLIRDGSEEISGFLRGKNRWMFTREPIKAKIDGVHTS